MGSVSDAVTLELRAGIIPVEREDDTWTLGAGPACANLGGLHLATKAALPIDLVVRHGEMTGRRCCLRLRVDAAQRILVSGRVVEIGRGDLFIERA